MKTIWNVIIMVLDEKSCQPLVIFRGGWEKIYAICSNKGDAISIKEEIDRLGTNGLRKLKILKQGERMTKCFISIPYAIDNNEAILKKLRSI